jgi:hypothetical protein
MDQHCLLRRDMVFVGTPRLPTWSFITGLFNIVCIDTMQIAAFRERGPLERVQRERLIFDVGRNDWARISKEANPPAWLVC